MIEAIVPAVVAVITGMAVLHGRAHARIDAVSNRVASVDRRIDAIELNTVRDFVQKRELSEIIGKMEGHMIRIEDKLDNLRPFRRDRDDREKE